MRSGVKKVPFLFLNVTERWLLFTDVSEKKTIGPILKDQVVLEDRTCHRSVTYTEELKVKAFWVIINYHFTGAYLITCGT
jgi:hypothetical protein